MALQRPVLAKMRLLVPMPGWCQLWLCSHCVSEGRSTALTPPPFQLDSYQLNADSATESCGIEPRGDRTQAKRDRCSEPCPVRRGAFNSFTNNWNNYAFPWRCIDDRRGPKRSRDLGGSGDTAVFCAASLADVEGAGAVPPCVMQSASVLTE